MRNLEDFLDSVGAHPTTKASEWLMDCWECGRHLLFFNVEKVIGFCVFCNKTRSLAAIAREVAHIPMRQIEEFIEQHRLDELRVGTFRESMEMGLLSEEIRQADIPLREMKWPEGYRSLYDGRASVIGRKAAQYMVNRGFDLGELYELQFGYCDSGEYAGRIVVPTFINGRLVYWQCRDFTGTVPKDQKILNPTHEYGANGKSQVLFNYDRAKGHGCVIITESWGSCLATGVFATAVNGKTISDSQLKLLLTMDADTFIILFDGPDKPGQGVGEGTLGAWASAGNLATHRRTYIATLPYGDPNEVDKTVRNKAVRDCVLYSKAAHLRFKLSLLGK